MVHVGAGDHDARARRRENVTEGVVASLAEAIARDANHLVLVSSAMVYGAWANNPVPLTEDAILRPDVEFVYARQLATGEAMADRWRRQRPGRTVHDPAASRSDGRLMARRSWPGRSPPGSANAPVRKIRPRSSFTSTTWRPPSSSPLARSARRRVQRGARWLGGGGAGAGAHRRAATGGTPGLGRGGGRRAALAVPTAARSREACAATPGRPWVVANDRLKSRGWRSTVTNEQAYVEGTETKWWTMVSPKRRQEIALATMGAGGAIGLLTLVAALLVVMVVSPSPPRI